MIGCYNPGTGEWKFAQPDQIGIECLNLIRQDPSWQIRNCYTCC
jgi:hypothetical protein